MELGLEFQLLCQQIGNEIRSTSFAIHQIQQTKTLTTIRTKIIIIQIQ
jgi:hypothetical protein